MANLIKTLLCLTILAFGNCLAAFAQTEIEATQTAKKLHAAGKFEEELAYIDRIITALPKSAKLWTMRGDANFELEEFEKTIEDCTKAIELDPTYGTAYLVRGIGLKSLGKFKESIADLKLAVKYDKTLIRAYLVMGVDHIRLKQWNEAVENLSTVIKLDKSKKLEPLARFFRGAAYGNLQKYNLAVQDFEAVMKAQPENRDAQALLKKYRPLINQAKKKLQSKKGGKSDAPWDDK